MQKGKDVSTGSNNVRLKGKHVSKCIKLFGVLGIPHKRPFVITPKTMQGLFSIRVKISQNTL